jgi:ankyrin repeat protein
MHEYLNIWDILENETLTNEEIAWIETFLKDKANVGIRHRWGWTPIYMAARNGHFEVVQLLIEKGADINTKDNDGWTPLYVAAWNNYFKVMQLLIENGADIETKSTDGRTPLHGAATCGHFQGAQLLIENGADIEAKDNQGWTPLYVAAWYGCFEVAQLLIKKGANVEAKDYQGNTPLGLAAWNGYVEILQSMIEEVEINLSEEIINLISSCIYNNKGKEQGFSLLRVIRDFETDFAKNLAIILEYYESLKKATPINLLINLKNICTNPENKNILEELIKCEKRKLLASVEKPRLVNYLARYTELVDISFLIQLKRENTLNQQSEKEKSESKFSPNS